MTKLNKEELIELLLADVKGFNRCRNDYPDQLIDLTGADLECADLECANLENSYLIDASLWSANLISANLTNANLKDANLISANLISANLTNANLEGADLENTNLEGADLTDANLTWADLTWANLTNANLTNADLTNANLKESDLTGTKIDYEIEENLLAKIKNAILKTPSSLEMDVWHQCETVHCVAGWATVLSLRGKELERKYGTQVAGLLLLGAEAHSHFFDTNKDAIKWLESI